MDHNPRHDGFPETPPALPDEPKKPAMGALLTNTSGIYKTKAEQDYLEKSSICECALCMTGDE